MLREKALLKQTPINSYALRLKIFTTSQKFNTIGEHVFMEACSANTKEDGSMNRKCKICKQEKQDSLMITNRNRCKECHAEHQRSWRKTKNGAAYSKSVNSKRKQVRFKNKVLSRSSCVTCGEKDTRVLEFDHIDPTTKIDNVSRMVKDCRPISEIKEEMRKCQVLCFNCHVKKTINERK